MNALRSKAFAAALLFPLAFAIGCISTPSIDSQAAQVGIYPPVVSTGGPYSGVTGSPVTFSAYGSSDPQGAPLTTFSWNFGDGATGSGGQVQHTYTSPGSYTVKVTVTDFLTLTSTASTTAQISTPAQPTARAGGPYTGQPGVPISFTAAGSSDPQGEPLTYTWNFGDGSTGTGLTPQHTYSTTATYSVTVTATDTSGLSATASTSAQVGATGSLPTANAGGPYTGYIETPITFNGGGSTDPQGQALTYAWNFGDGSTGTSVSPTHTYTTVPGTFTVTLKVTDTSGLSSTATTKVTLGYTPPTVTINGPYSGKPTLPVFFRSSVTDPIDNDWSYSWSFGDGGTSNVPSPAHTYAAAGIYNVSLLVVGQYNESTTVNSTATIVVEASGPAFSGTLETGTTPIAGAHVYLYAANSTGYGQPSLSLLSNTGTSDANGSYVLSGSTGGFSIPAGFNCPTHSQVYLYAAGGTAGSTTNTGSTLMAALGACGYLSTGSGTVVINEATTIAAAYAMSGYATSPTHVSSPSTSAALTGIGSAFLNAANLVSPTTGTALATTANGNGTAPQAVVNTLANILHACVDSATSSTACNTLFTTTSTADTASAALAIAHNQGANVASLYALQSSSPSQAFLPATATVPHDFTLPISYTGAYQTVGLTVDAGNNVWVLQYPTTYGTEPYLTEFLSNGDVQQSENTTCNSGTEAIPAGIAADPAGNIWLLAVSGSTYIDINDNEQSYYTSQYCIVSPAGTMLSPSGGYSLGGSQASSVSLYNFAIDGKGNGWFPDNTLLGKTINGATDASYIPGNAPSIINTAIDGQGNFWLTTGATNGILELSSSGSLVSGANGYIGGGLYQPGPIAIDNGGNVWAINTQQTYLYAGTSISKLSSTGTPLSGSGYTSAALSDPFALAIDGAGNVWVANGSSPVTTENNSVVELGPSGAVTMYIAHANQQRAYLDGPDSIAVDGAGSVWLSDGLANSVTQFVGVATPVVTPLASNLAAPYNAPASKP